MRMIAFGWSFFSQGIVPMTRCFGPRVTPRNGAPSKMGTAATLAPRAPPLEGFSSSGQRKRKAEEAEPEEFEDPDEAGRTCPGTERPVAMTTPS